MSSSKTVLIAGGGTGGHLMPALSIATALRARHPDWRIVLLGAERGLEARLLPQRDFPYTLLPFEPLYRHQWWRNLRWPWLAGRLLLQIRSLLRAERPALVVGTGGYVSGPVVWLAARHGVPTAILEQDARPGLATRWLARVVRHIYLGAPEARALLRPGPKTELFHTGSPISPPAPGRREEAARRWGLSAGGPVILVTGGSQGALAINQLVAEWIRGGDAEGLTILWATGRASYAEFRELHRPPNVQVFDFLDPIADAYAVADCAVCRAGMMTIAELCAWGIPSILIPLPTAAADHQTPNAVAMEQAGAAILLRQADVNAQLLGSKVRALVADRVILTAMRERALARGRPQALLEIQAHLEDALR